MEEYLKTKGRIFDIQRYSIHDGNGIRTIVFLKGCVLRCRWCCNPESQHYEIETMMVQGEPKVIGEDTTVAEVMKTVEKDRTYYRRTGGGLTLSGGESLCQPKFARDLLRAAKESGITTAMESMGCAPYSTIEEILPYLDQYLLDMIQEVDTPKILAINKMDLMKPEDYLELYNRYSEMNIFDDIYGVSALNGTNVEELIERLTGYMEEGPMYYPEDMATCRIPYPCKFR